MSGSINQFSVHTENGSTFLGGFTLEGALDVAKEVESRPRQKVIRISQGQTTVLEGASLAEALKS